MSGAGGNRKLQGENSRQQGNSDLQQILQTLCRPRESSSDQRGRIQKMEVSTKQLLWRRENLENFLLAFGLHTK